MIRNNPDIAALAVVTLALALWPAFNINFQREAPEPRVIRITELLELESARIALLSANTARNLEQCLRQRINIECLKQRLHE